MSWVMVGSVFSFLPTVFFKNLEATLFIIATIICRHPMLSIWISLKLFCSSQELMHFNIKTLWKTLQHADKLPLSTVNPFPNKPWFLRVCCTSLMKTQWEKEKLLVTSNFSFSQCFLGVWITFYHFHQI